MNSEGTTLRGIRRMIGASLILGMIGTGVELLLIGHYESAPQFAPLVGIGSGLVSLAWLLAAPRRAAVQVVRIVMLSFVLLGGVGVGLHVTGNRDFELEMYPTRSGWDLTWKTLTGATPVLAPGAMALLGLIGLAHTHRHPAAGGAAGNGGTGGTES